MSTTLKPIETRYAGCRFRSRLEARYAVLFDHLGIRWEYEAQGYEVSYRLHPCTLDEKFRYLPDFWLPDLQVWVEVKGALEDEWEYWTLLNAAASLSSNDGGGCHDAGGHDLVICGPLPSKRDRRIPWRMHLHKGDLTASPWTLTKTSCADFPMSEVIADDSGSHTTWGLSEDVFIAEFLRGSPEVVITRCYVAALDAARSARFEHGEQG